MSENLNVVGVVEARRVLASILEDEAVELRKVTLGGAAEKGAGYSSFLVKVAVDGVPKNLNLVFKCCPRHQGYRSHPTVMAIALREMRFYESVLPSLLQENAAVKEPFTNVPRCYKIVKAEGRELLVLEDIVELGYKSWNRKDELDDEHIDAVLRCYGKFHALSHALREHSAESFRRATAGLDDIFGYARIPKEMLDMFVFHCDELKRLFDGDEKLLAAATKFGDGLNDYLKYVDENPGKYPVVYHGDCWISNVMFKYEDAANPKRPTDLVLFDFQIIGLGSPIRDVAYFLMASCTKEKLNNMKRYLDVYYESTCQHLRRLGCDPSVAYPEDAFREEWRTYAGMGFLYGMSALKVMLRDEEGVVDMSDGASTDDVVAALKNEKNSEYAEKRMRDMFAYLYENGMV